MRRIPATILITALGMTLAGCSAKAPPQPGFRALGEKVTGEEPRSDEAIGHDVRQQLNLIGTAAYASVVAEVIDGVVTLRGSVANQAAAFRAIAAAKAVAGVKAVRNELVLIDRL